MLLLAFLQCNKSTLESKERQCFSFLRGKYKHQKELLFLSGEWQLWILIWTKTCENAHYSNSFPVYWKTCLREIDGKAESLFSRQPETQLIQWWQVLWKGFHHFQHNNGIHSNIIKQTKWYWNLNLFILSSCHTSTMFIPGSREMIFSDFKTTQWIFGFILGEKWQVRLGWSNENIVNTILRSISHFIFMWDCKLVDCLNEIWNGSTKYCFSSA